MSKEEGKDQAKVRQSLESEALPQVTKPKVEFDRTSSIDAHRSQPELEGQDSLKKDPSPPPAHRVRFQLDENYPVEAEPIRSQKTDQDKKPKVNRRRPPKEEQVDDQSNRAEGVRPKEEVKKKEKLGESEMKEVSQKERLGCNNKHSMEPAQPMSYQDNYIDLDTIQTSSDGNVMRPPETFENMEKRLVSEVRSDIARPKEVIDRKKKRLKDEEEDGPPKYASFLKNLDAKNFKVSVQNYSELNFYEYKNQLRNEMQGILEPYIKQSADDRSQFMVYERHNRHLESRIRQLEQIIFHQEEISKMDLFKKIYASIKEVDSQRLMEEEKLRSLGRQNRENIERLLLDYKNMTERVDLVQKQLLTLNDSLKSQYEKSKQWQQDFLTKYDANQTKIINEIDETSKKALKNQKDIFENRREINTLISKAKIAEQVMDKHQGWLHKIQEQSNKLEAKKLNQKDFEKHRTRVDIELDIQREVSENHENHFAMVENFVEKFVPIRIQSQISQTLHELLRGQDKQLERLKDFEKTKFMEMHQIVLDDDGIPELIEQMKEIQFNIDTIYNKQYKGPKQIQKKSRQDQIAERLKNLEMERERAKQFVQNKVQISQTSSLDNDELESSEYDDEYSSSRRTFSKDPTSNSVKREQTIEDEVEEPASLQFQKRITGNKVPEPFSASAMQKGSSTPFLESNPILAEKAQNTQSGTSLGVPPPAEEKEEEESQDIISPPVEMRAPDTVDPEFVQQKIQTSQENFKRKVTYIQGKMSFGRASKSPEMTISKLDQVPIINETNENEDSQESLTPEEEKETNTHANTYENLSDPTLKEGGEEEDTSRLRNIEEALEENTSGGEEPPQHLAASGSVIGNVSGKAERQSSSHQQSSMVELGQQHSHKQLSTKTKTSDPKTPFSSAHTKKSGMRHSKASGSKKSDQHSQPKEARRISLQINTQKRPEDSVDPLSSQMKGSKKDGGIQLTSQSPAKVASSAVAKQRISGMQSLPASGNRDKVSLNHEEPPSKSRPVRPSEVDSSSKYDDLQSNYSMRRRHSLKKKSRGLDIGGLLGEQSLKDTLSQLKEISKLSEYLPKTMEEIKSVLVPKLRYEMAEVKKDVDSRINHMTKRIDLQAKQFDSGIVHLQTLMKDDMDMIGAKRQQQFQQKLTIFEKQKVGSDLDFIKNKIKEIEKAQDQMAIIMACKQQKDILDFQTDKDTNGSLNRSLADPLSTITVPQNPLQPSESLAKIVKQNRRTIVSPQHMRGGTRRSVPKGPDSQFQHVKQKNQEFPLYGQSILLPQSNQEPQLILKSTKLSTLSAIKNRNFQPKLGPQRSITRSTDLKDISIFGKNRFSLPNQPESVKNSTSQGRLTQSQLNLRKKINNQRATSVDIMSDNMNARAHHSVYTPKPDTQVNFSSISTSINRPMRNQDALSSGEAETVNRNRPVIMELLLKKVNEVMNECQVFQRNRLSSSRVLNDCIQYIKINNDVTFGDAYRSESHTLEAQNSIPGARQRPPSQGQVLDLIQKFELPPLQPEDNLEMNDETDLGMTNQRTTEYQKGYPGQGKLSQRNNNTTNTSVEGNMAGITVSIISNHSNQLN